MFIASLYAHGSWLMIVSWLNIFFEPSLWSILDYLFLLYNSTNKFLLSLSFSFWD